MEGAAHPEEFFSIGASKDEVIEALKHHSDSLINIHLAQPMTPLSQAIKDFRRERVLFNEVPFIPDNADPARNVGFALTLNEYVRRIRERFPTGVDNSQNRNARGRSVSVFTERDADSTRGSSGGKKMKDGEANGKERLLNLDDMTSAEIILQRSCRSSAGTDSFFMIQKLFCAEGTLVTQRSNILGFVPFINGEPPVVIDVYLEDEGIGSKQGAGGDGTDLDKHGEAATATLTEQGSDDNKVPPTGSSVSTVISSGVKREICDSGDGEVAGDDKKVPQLIGEIRICNSFAVYDVDAVDLISGDADTDPPPWLEVETVITDHCNFATGEQRRVLEVQVYCPSLNTYYPPLEARKTEKRNRLWSSGDW